MVHSQVDTPGRKRQGRTPKLFAALSLGPAFAVLAGCMAPMQMAAPPPPPMAAQPLASEPMMALPTPLQPAPQAPQPTPGLAARERLQLAINQLQQGDAVHAEVELQAYLAEVPNNAPAR